MMFSHKGGPDNTGAALRLGYGAMDNFELEAKSGLFDGVSLVGDDGHLRLYDRKDTVVGVSIGGHHAFVRDALDSNALDVAASLGHWFSPRVQFYAGAAYSFEKLDGVPSRLDSTFDRWYVVPGFRGPARQQAGPAGRRGRGPEPRQPALRHRRARLQPARRRPGRRKNAIAEPLGRPRAPGARRGRPPSAPLSPPPISPVDSPGVCAYKR